MNFFGSVKHVYNVDLDVSGTVFSIEINDVSLFPDDITEIIVTAPDSSIIATMDDFNTGVSFGKDQIWYYNPYQPPIIGEYNFSITADGQTKTDKNELKNIRNIDFPDISSLLPLDYTIISGNVVTFTWDLPVEKNIYYTVDVRDLSSNLIDRYPVENDITSMKYTLPSGDYKWRLQITDHNIWKQIDNRSQNNWKLFSIV